MSAYLESTGAISRYRRNGICRDVREALAGIRALGLTRPGQPAAGLAGDVAIERGDIPVDPERGEPGRDLPPEVMAVLCANLDSLEPAEVRVATQIGIDTGRRPEDILALPLDCLSRDKDGSAVLVYDNTKTADDVRWFEVQPCYVFHPLNAFDDGDRIVLDVVRHPTVFTDGHDLFPQVRTLDRWTVDLTADSVIEERLDDTSQEFPRVDERLVGRPHRYGYAVGYTPGSRGLSSPDAILKHDVVTRSTQPVSFGAGRQPSEFVFVPSAPDAAEDDGVAMGFVYDRSNDRSDLVLLDAQTLETLATAHLPARVPNGFHGNWVPTEG